MWLVGCSFVYEFFGELVGRSSMSSSESESFPTSPAGESRVGASSSWALSPSTSGEGEPSARCRNDQPAVPRLRRRDGASTILPFEPEHQQFPSPISRAEIVPEAPFVARSGYTCRREVRAADHIGGGSDSRSRTRRWTTRAGKSQLSLFLWVCVNDCGWRLSLK